MSLSDLIPTNALKTFWDDSWNSNKSIGQYYPGNNAVGGGLHRGANWYDGAYAGVFTAYMENLPTFTHPSVGFRCAVAVP